MVEARAGDLRVAHVGGIDVIVTPLWAAGTVLMIGIFASIGHYVFHHGLANVLVGGVALALAHWVSEVVHNLGHNYAARATGHPMIGTRLGFLLVLGVSLYPPDEPELSPETHIRRALGGPIGSAVFTVVLGFLALALAGTSAGWMALLWFLDNLLIFTLGAWLPLGFNDVSTILHWMGSRGQGTGAAED